MKTDLKKESCMVNTDSPMGKLTSGEKMVVILAGVVLVALACLDTPLKAFLTFGSVVFWIGVGGMFTISVMPTELLPSEEEKHFPA